MGDQKKSFEHEARSPPPAPGLHRPPRGLHCCRRHWVWRLSKELLLHMSNCQLCLHHHLHLHPCHHWHLLFGFPNNNEDLHGMLRRSSSSFDGSHLPHIGHQQCHHCSHWLTKSKSPQLIVTSLHNGNQQCHHRSHWMKYMC